MISSILVVCVGNVCRSPIGERLLAQRCPNIHAASAGIKALVGQNASGPSIEVAARNGLDIEGHVAHQFTPKLAAQFDLILVMEEYQMIATASLAPTLGNKTMLFGEWIGKSDIADPYELDANIYAATFELLKSASDAWAARLKDGWQPAV